VARLLLIPLLNQNGKTTLQAGVKFLPLVLIVLLFLVIIPPINHSVPGLNLISPVNNIPFHSIVQLAPLMVPIRFIMPQGIILAVVTIIVNVICLVMIVIIVMMDLI